MNIQTKKVCSNELFEIAIDEDNGTLLLGVLTDHGCTSFVNYYRLSEPEFNTAMDDIRSLSKKVKSNLYGELYYSPHNAYKNNDRVHNEIT